MSLDIQHALADWEYRPNEISVRLVAGLDGRDKIQLRLDLGLLQMEVDGRPDGLRPEGLESYLDLFQSRAAAQDQAAPDSRPFQLSSADCELLLREGVQYYHRYVSFWHLERYELCARDTARNLRLFAFVKAYAAADRDKLQFDQWRPYVTMMHAKAVATPLVGLEDYDTALAVVEAGIRKIWDFLSEYHQEGRADQCAELNYLQEWRNELRKHTKQLPAPERPEEPALDDLRAELERAVAEERFEDAARLRDELRTRGGGATPRPSPEQM